MRALSSETYETPREVGRRRDSNSRPHDSRGHTLNRLVPQPVPPRSLGSGTGRRVPGRSLSARHPGVPSLRRPPLPPSGAPARSPAALPRAPRPGGCGAPGSGRPAPRRRRTRAVARSSRTSSEPGRARGTAAPTPAPRSPQTWPSARRRALHLSQVTAGRGLPDPAPGPRPAAPRARHPSFLPACLRRRVGVPRSGAPGPRRDLRAGSAGFGCLCDFLLN